MTIDSGNETKTRSTRLRAELVISASSTEYRYHLKKSEANVNAITGTGYESSFQNFIFDKKLARLGVWKAPIILIL